jgi:hypothetical protein
LAGLMLAISIAQPAPAGPAEKSANVTLLGSFAYEGVQATDQFFTSGTDIDFSGKYVYAMQQGPEGGIHIFDASKAKPKKITFIPCPGEQNDVAVVKPGLIAIGYHSSTCAGIGSGVRLIDVKNPKAPKFLGAVNDLPGGTHTLTVYPGQPIIYASPGGLNNGDGIEQILDVSNPKAPEVAATFTPNPAGCHDVSFYVTEEMQIAACAGFGETQLWDVSDPLAPETIGHIVNPAIFFHHSAAFTYDGHYLVLGDEAFVATDCLGAPTGALWIYDITDPTTPLLQGFFKINRSDAPVSSPDIDRGAWCTAHIFNFVPGTYTLVASWYAGGMNVIDWSNPMSPQEIAYYRTPDVNYWSAYWYDGRIWANDRERGALDVFAVEGLEEPEPE